MACIKRRRGRWVVDFRDQEGRRRWESYRTKDEATNALGKRLGELRTGTYRPPAETPTFRTVAEAWLEGRRAMGLRMSTIAGWETHLEVHLLPTFGDVKLDQIDVLAIERFRDERRQYGRAGRKPLAGKTINKLLATMSAIFTFAARRHLIDRNPAKLAERFTRQNGERIGDEVQPDQVLSPEEAARVIGKAEAGYYRTLFLTAYLTGARIGELTALFWSDVDFSAKTLRIERSVSWAKARAAAKEPTKPTITPPKSKSSKRTLSIPDELVSALRRWKLACPPSELGLVFPNAEGTPRHRSTIAAEGLRPAVAAAGIKKRVSMHTFRHSFATFLITAGEPVNVVAKKLGHEKPDVTLRTYTHWFNRKEDTGNVDALARLVCASSAEGGSSLVAV